MSDVARAHIQNYVRMCIGNHLEKIAPSGRTGKLSSLARRKNNMLQSSSVVGWVGHWPGTACQNKSGNCEIRLPVNFPAPEIQHELPGTGREVNRVGY